MQLEITHLLSQLASEDAVIQREAVRALWAHGAASVTPLIEMLRHPKSLVQAATAETLGLIGDRRAVPALVDMLHGRTYHHMREEGSPGRYDRIVTSAAIALARIDSPEAVAELQRASAIENNDVRGAAIIGLGYVKTEISFQTLLAALSDAALRGQAVESLGRMGDSRAVEPLLKHLRSASTWVQQVITAQALGSLGDARADGMMREIFQNPDTLITDQYDGISRSTKRLGLRVKAARALGLMGVPESVALLRQSLHHESEDERDCAAIGLAYLREVQVFEHVVSLLKHRQITLVKEAIAALEFWGDPLAIPPLEDYARQERFFPETAVDALRAVERIQGRG